jgi:hypothetical protein
MGGTRLKGGEAMTIKSSADGGPAERKVEADGTGPADAGTADARPAEVGVHRFDTQREINAHLLACIVRSRASLHLFDPDFHIFNLGHSETDAALRQFLLRGGSLQLAMHRADLIERSYPRFINLLKDFSHRIECRLTSKNLHHLTDSFCVGDRTHIVRRFHCDHLRGEAVFGTPEAAEISLERFEGIWAESRPGLQASTTGL